LIRRISSGNIIFHVGSQVPEGTVQNTCTPDDRSLLPDPITFSDPHN
jgi:hypothetical protein